MTSTGPKLNFARLFRIWCEHKINTLNEFRSTIDEPLKREVNHIRKELSDLKINRTKYNKEEYLDLKDNLQIDLEDLKPIIDVRDEMLIIALYKITELYLKHILVRKFHGEINADEIMKYNITEIKKQLRKKKISLASINHWDSVNELRAINNAIKHEGRVSTELAKFRGWRKGENLKGLDAVYERIAPKIPVFIEELSRRAFDN